ncbi:MAG: hypothetical protein WAX66_00435 [Patescibacteria group bacterium]
MGTFNINEVGLVFELIGNLQGDKGDDWLRELGKFLQGRNTWDGVSDLTTINIGICEDIGDLIKKFESTEEIMYLSFNGNVVRKRIASITPSKKPFQLDLITITPEDLGLGRHFDCSEWKSICEAAVKRGFIICPEEAVLQLQVKYRGKNLIVITQPTLSTEPVDYKKLWLYDVGDNGGGHCRIVAAPEEGVLANYAECVFVRSFKEIES